MTDTATTKMRVVGDRLMIRNGSNRWMTPVMDDATGSFYKNQKEASKAIGVHKATVSSYLRGESDIKESGRYLRLATAADVKRALGDVEYVTTPGKSKGKKKTKKPAKAKMKAKAGATASEKRTPFRVRGTVTEIWSEQAGAWRKSKHSAPHLRRAPLNGRYVEVSALERQKLAADGDRKPAFKDKSDKHKEPQAMFMAVAWPDGQVSVRSARGDFFMHRQTMDEVPEEIRKASDVYELEKR